jgi:hypothetical protein
LTQQSAFVELGVAPKQKANARFAFDRSAQEARFFDAGRERLVLPIVKNDPLSYASSSPKEASSVDPADSNSRDGGQRLKDNTDNALGPLIVALLGKLPKAGLVWPMAARARWLRTLAMNFAQVNLLDEKDKDEMEIEIKVIDLLQGL